MCYGYLMTRADIIRSLKTRATDIRALGATSLYLFGSAARGEAGPDSDIDFFVDYDPERFSFVELIRLREQLSQILGRPADLTTREGATRSLPDLRPMILAAIKKAEQTE